MALYSVATNRAGINTANSPMLELRTSASARAIIREVGISMAVLPSTAPRFVLARATNTPAGGTNNVPIALDTADAASLHTFNNPTWTTAPTFSTTGPWLKVAGLPLTLGAGFIWTFAGPGLMVPISASLILANLNASGATLGSFDIYFIWDE